ncbi:MAG: DNA cytosine methyltransferase [Candidatus Helarchaeota archaeon]
MNNFTYKWKLTDLENVTKNKLNVFSCFSCGGGSTMGYKMSGFNVLGCNEIDPKMMSVYIKNHNPKYHYLEGIQEFKLREDLPEELYNLDILDGSPPCSSFSMSGSREKKWGKKNKFREGQSDQILDDLFFHYIDLAKKLKPKIVIAENVKGIILGKAKGYTKEIIKKFKEIDYDIQVFLLNGATMGLPQKRERVFFICRRADLCLKKINLDFNEKTIPAKEILLKNGTISRELTEKSRNYWENCEIGKSFSTVANGSWFNAVRINPELPLPTITASGYRASVGLFHPHEPRKLYNEEHMLGSSYPTDYNFCDIKQPIYQMGMSVPPLMMYKISKEIAKQWFKVEYE